MQYMHVFSQLNNFLFQLSIFLSRQDWCVLLSTAKNQQHQDYHRYEKYYFYVPSFFTTYPSSNVSRERGC